MEDSDEIEPKPQKEWDDSLLHKLYGYDPESMLPLLVALGECAVEPLCLELPHADEMTRSYIITALEQIGAPAVPSLRRLTKHADDMVRYKSVKVLGDIRHPSAASELYESLKDEDRYVRLAAAEALTNLGTPAVQWYCQALKDEDAGVRTVAAKALTQIGNADAVDALCTALDDREVAVRLHAVKALGSILDARSIDKLRHAFKDSNDTVRRNAAWGLVRLGVESAEIVCELLGDPDERVSSEAGYVLARIGAPSLKPLCNILQNKRTLGYERAEKVFLCIDDLRAVEHLCLLLNENDKPLRSLAAKALSNMGNEKELPRQVLLAEMMPMPDRIRALKAMQKVNYRDLRMRLNYSLPDIREFCETLVADSDIRVREAAQRGLDVLKGDTLLRPGQRDSPTEKRQLLRAAAGSDVAQFSDELVRGSEAPSEQANGKVKSGLLSRFRKRR